MNLLLKSTLVACLLLPTIAFAQREKRTINDGWKFTKTTIESTTPPDQDWEDINIPHCWNTDAYVVSDFYKGYGWYKRNIQIPEDWAGKQITLRIDGALKYTDVFLNGKEIGNHAGAYTASAFDITSSLKEGINELMIRVDNVKPYIIPIQGDFTFFGGLYRDVWLTATEAQCFTTTNMASDGIYISTPAVSAESATINIKSIIDNKSNEKSNLIIEQTILDPKGALVQTLKQPITLKPGESKTIEQLSKAISNPTLWTPETPNLYQVISSIKDKKSGKILDEMKHVTAFRWYKFDGREGFFLNGKPYKLHGVCRHQDQKPIGTALTDDMHRRDFRMMKEMGVNFIRISHYPQDDALLEMCDREGMLVWEEIPIINIVKDIEGFNDVCEANLREMIRQHYNHPSIVCWGFMNEIFLTTYRQIKDKEKLAITIKRTEDLAKRLSTALHEEDPIRKSCIAFHGSHDYNKTELNGLFDLYGWNLYAGWYGGNLSGFEQFLEQEYKNYPDQARLISEYGAGSDKRIHSLKPKAFDFSSEYQQVYLEHYIPTIENTKYLCGGTAWNFIDFGSAHRNESMPRINNKGLVRADRTPKDVYYYYKACWRPDLDFVYIGSRDWTERTGVQKGNEATPMTIKVFSNMDEVELFMDNQSLGTKPVENYVATFEAPFKNNVPFGIAQRHNFRAIAKGKKGKNVTAEDDLAIAYTAIPSTLTKENIEHLELGVNVGSDCAFTSDISRFTWVPDQPYTEGSWGYIEGKAATSQTQVIGTYDDPLFQTHLADLKAYRFDTPVGDYELELSFNDIYTTTKGLIYNLDRNPKNTTEECVFDIIINGKNVETSFSPSKLSGNFHAITRRYIVSNTEGNVTVEFGKIKGKTILSAIKLRKL